MVERVHFYIHKSCYQKKMEKKEIIISVPLKWDELNN